MGFHFLKVTGQHMDSSGCVCSQHHRDHSRWQIILPCHERTPTNIRSSVTYRMSMLESWLAENDVKVKELAQTMAMFKKRGDNQ